MTTMAHHAETQPKDTRGEAYTPAVGANSGEFKSYPRPLLIAMLNDYVDIEEAGKKLDQTINEDTARGVLDEAHVEKSTYLTDFLESRKVVLALKASQELNYTPEHAQKFVNERLDIIRAEREHKAMQQAREHMAKEAMRDRPVEASHITERPLTDEDKTTSERFLDVIRSFYISPETIRRIGTAVLHSGSIFLPKTENPDADMSLMDNDDPFIRDSVTRAIGQIKPSEVLPADDPHLAETK